MKPPKTLEDLKVGQTETGNTFLSDPDRPSKPQWFNEEKFARGQDFFKRHVTSVCAGYFMALFVGFVVEPLAEAVLFTGQSLEPDQSRKRYLSTMAHIYAWHTTDIFDPLSLGYRSIHLVRSYHDSARKRMEQRDADTSNVISTKKVSQYDTALVQSGFVGPLCLYPSQFGVSCSDQDLDDYRFFWRVVGYVLGLEDQFNVCTGTLKDTRTMCKEVEQLIVVPALYHPADYYTTLSDAFLKGMANLVPFMQKPILQAFLYPLFGLPTPTVTFAQWIQVLCIKCNFWLLRNCSLYRRYIDYILLYDLERLKSLVFNRIDF